MLETKKEKGEDEDEDPPGMRNYMREEEEEDMDMVEPAGDMDMVEPAGDMDMEPDDMGMDMEPDDMGDGEDMEKLVRDAVEIIAKIAGEKVDVQIDGDGDMRGDAMPDEGGDLEGAMDAPAGDDEDLGVEMDDEGEGEEEIVAEVARRVAARLIREKKQDAVATKLAERIFRRLASK